MMLPPNQQSAIVAHPTKAALNFEALLVGFAVNHDGSAALFAPSLGAAASGNARFDAALSQALSKGTAVISPIRQQLARTGFGLPLAAFDAHGLQRLLGQLDFGGAGAIEMKAKGQAVSIGHQHPFGAFAFLGFAYSSPPFLAGTKLPSRKACAHSSLSPASRPANTARHTFSQTPASSHFLRRRHAVVGEPNSRGKSSQRQPVRSTNKITSKVCRSLARGRPIGFGKETKLRAEYTKFFEQANHLSWPAKDKISKAYIASNPYNDVVPGYEKMYRLMMPIGFLSSAFGFSIKWNGETKVVKITTQD